MSSEESENTTQPTEETPAEVSEEPTATEPETVVEETVEEIKRECGHPSNATGYHQKGHDGKCIYCGH